MRDAGQLLTDDYSGLYFAVWDMKEQKLPGLSVLYA